MNESDSHNYRSLEVYQPDGAAAQLSRNKSVHLSSSPVLRSQNVVYWQCTGGIVWLVEYLSLIGLFLFFINCTKSTESREPNVLMATMYDYSVTAIHAVWPMIHGYSFFSWFRNKLIVYNWIDVAARLLFSERHFIMWAENWPWKFWPESYINWIFNTIFK